MRNLPPGFVLYRIGCEVTFAHSIVVAFRGSGDDCDDREHAFDLAMRGGYGVLCDMNDWTLDAVALKPNGTGFAYIGVDGRRLE